MNNNYRRNEIFTDAMKNLMEDKLGMSFDLLDEIIKADSNDKLALLTRGSIYLKMGNDENAIATLTAYWKSIRNIKKPST